MPIVTGHGVARRGEAVEVRGGVVELVFEVAPAVLPPLAHERAGRDGDLVGGGADDGADVDPVGVAGEVGVAAVLRTVPCGRRHEVDLGEAITLARRGIGQGAPVVVADDRGHVIGSRDERTEVAEERAVLRELRIADVILEAAVPARDGEAEGAHLPRLHRRAEVIDAVRETRVVLDQRRVREVDGGVVACVEREVDRVERLRERVGDHFTAADGHVAAGGVEVNGVSDAPHVRLRKLRERFVRLLVVGLNPLPILRSLDAIQHLGVPSDPAAAGRKGEGARRGGDSP